MVSRQEIKWLLHNPRQGMGPTSCSQVKRTGGLNAQELGLGKMRYHFSTFGVGRFIIGVDWGVLGAYLGVSFARFALKVVGNNLKIALF